MKAFLAALVAVVVIAVAVHYAFRELAPEWNVAAVQSAPSVRIGPEVVPSPDW